MKPKIAFIEPTAYFSMFPNFKLPMIGPVYLATMLKDAGYDTHVYSEHFKRVYNYKKNQIKKELLDYDVVCISIMSCAAKRGYRMAELIKRANPGVKIIIGGSHASFMPQEALEYSDQVVIGEGEEVIIDMIEEKITDKIVTGKPVENLDNLPIPDFNLVKYAKLPRKNHAFPISTSRGCPYDCSFCSVTKLFGRRFRYRSAEKIIDEIKQRVKEGNRSFFFYDDNFMANIPRVKKILKKLIADGVKFSWSAQARASVTQDEELLELMAKTNCYFLMMGLESINDQVLKDMNKKQDLNDIKQAIKKLNKHGIGVYGSFILGPDSDPPNSFGSTSLFCKSNQFLVATFSILTPFPGTDLYRQLDRQQRIFTKDWNVYDGIHTVFKTKVLPPIEVQLKNLWIWKQFYCLPRVISNVFKGKIFEALLYAYLRFKVMSFTLFNRRFLKKLKTIEIYDYNS